MKSVERTAREVSPEQSQVWLEKVREKASKNLDAAFLANVMKRRAETWSAFTAGILLGLCGQILNLVSVLYAWYALGALSTLGVVVSLLYVRKSLKASLASIEHIRAASSTIKIVDADEDDKNLEGHHASLSAPEPRSSGPS